MKQLSMILFIFVISSCSKNDLREYQDNSPQLTLFEYFNGNIKGWGIIQDRQGNLIRQFVVKIYGTVSGNTITLDEDFTFSDGGTSIRTWTITKRDTHTFRGEADDVIGSASGTTYGNVLNWQYYLNIEVDGSVWKIHFDDWMYLQPNDILINKAKMSKFGIHLGDVTITFQKMIDQEDR